MNPEPVLSVDGLKALAADPEFAWLAGGTSGFFSLAPQSASALRTDSAPRCGSEKPALRARRGLQSRWLERKSQKTTLTRHEHEPK
jgi:hypothetical protein